MQLRVPVALSFSTPLGLLVWALVLSVLIRLPFVPFAVLNWDESTFALVGDSLVRGHLPYTEIVENKPPLIYVLFALIQVLFGKSLLAIRLTAIVLTALSAWTCALLAHRAFDLRGWAVLTLLPVIVLSTIHPGVGALMTEHVVILFLGVILLGLTRTSFRPWHGFVISTCAALAVLTRTNLAYPALLLGAGALFLPLATGVRRRLFLAAFAAGALWPVVCLLAAYRHHLDLLYGSVIRGPLIYAEGGRLFTTTWFRELRSLGSWVTMASVLPLMTSVLLGTIFILVRPVYGGSARRTLAMLLVGGAATLAGICAGGRIFGHYLIQMLPFAAPLFAVTIKDVGARWRALSWLVLLFPLIAWSEPVTRTYLHHVRRLAEGQPLWNDRAMRVVRYLEQAGARGQTLFLAEAHIGYWMLDSIPPTRVGHPSNLGRTAMTSAVVGPEWSSLRELAAIFDQQPAFVVLPQETNILKLEAEARAYLWQRVEQDYQLVQTVDDLLIYRRVLPDTP